MLLHLHIDRNIAYIVDFEIYLLGWIYELADSFHYHLII